MSERQLPLEDACHALPVFPLPTAVLMPDTLMPLHVFEERYQVLVEHALTTDRRLGIATLQPGFQADYDGRPACWPEVGIGEIVRLERLPEGRFNLVLQSVGSALLEEELPEDPDEPFRRFRCRLLHATGSFDAHTETLRQLLLQWAWTHPDVASEVERLLSLPAEPMINQLAGQILEGSDERRAYLALTDRAARGEQVTTRMTELMLGTDAIRET